ncbi:MAG TPA: macro domain-containing protein [Micropepsaceae bacterium]|jgi:O-acetyl-ADP-ribose deacetylase (regulator of RNase III)|nr:macro domain-containing protein [Micropepsaceae bacterium]
MNLGVRLEAIEADITTLHLDAIVNAANSTLMPGGGVDGAIRRKAGREMDEDLYRIGHCAEGEAVITRGYGLPASRVIHTVAPIWAGGNNREGQEATLARCYDNALALADTHHLRTIAFPAIGTGAYGWPAEIAAKRAFERAATHLAACAIQTRIIFCCFSRADRERYADLIANLKEQCP